MKHTGTFAVSNSVIEQSIIIGCVLGPFRVINSPAWICRKVVICIIINIIFVSIVTAIALPPKAFAPGGKTFVEPQVGPGSGAYHIAKPLMGKFMTNEAFAPAARANACQRLVFHTAPCKLIIQRNEAILFEGVFAIMIRKPGGHEWNFGFHLCWVLTIIIIEPDGHRVARC